MEKGANRDVTGISDGERCWRDRVTIALPVPGYARSQIRETPANTFTKVAPDTRSQIRKTPDLQKYTSDTLRRPGSQILKYALETAICQTSKNRRPITAQCFVHSHRAKNKTREEQTPNMIVRSHRASCCQFRFKTDLLASRLDQAIMY